MQRKRRNANGVPNPSRIVSGQNHMGKPSSKRYALIPARAISNPNVSPKDMLVLATLGLFVSRHGVSFPTMETIKAYTGLSRVTVNACIKRLTIHGLIRKLQQKRYPSQTSKWLTNRYQILFFETDPIPTEEELKASIPFATDNIETLEETNLVADKQTETDKALADKSSGIERDVKSISQTYGYTIQTDNKSLLDLAALNPTRDQIAMAFKTYLGRFGSLPTTLQMLLDRGVFA